MWPFIIFKWDILMYVLYYLEEFVVLEWVFICRYSTRSRRINCQSLKFSLWFPKSGSYWLYPLLKGLLTSFTFSIASAQDWWSMMMMNHWWWWWWWQCSPPLPSQLPRSRIGDDDKMRKMMKMILMMMMMVVVMMMMVTIMMMMMLTSFTFSIASIQDWWWW